MYFMYEHGPYRMVLSTHVRSEFQNSMDFHRISIALIAMIFNKPLAIQVIQNERINWNCWWRTCCVCVCIVIVHTSKCCKRVCKILVYSRRKKDQDFRLQTNFLYDYIDFECGEVVLDIFFSLILRVFVCSLVENGHFHSIRSPFVPQSVIPLN